MRTSTGRFNNSIFIAFSILVVAVLISSAIVALASSKADIAFPVAELGGCKNETDCRAYCEQRDNADIIRACLTFAKKHNLLPADVIAKGEKFADVAAGGGPGGCRNEEDCVNFCDNPSHMTECLDFAIRYDLLPADELEDSKKVLKALKAGFETPGDCTRKDECLAYCENTAHIDECLAFAEKAGFISGKELAEAKKVAPFLKSGETPGGCKSKAECEAYCGYPDHVDECISFAEKLGLMTAREAELIKKAGGKSPGDCAVGSRNPEEAQNKCAVYCNKEENRQTCFKFAVQMGIMTAEEATQIGVYSDFQACYAVTTPKIRQCLDENLGQEVLKRLLEGQMPLKLEELEKMMAKIRNARDCTNRYADQQLQTFTDDPDALDCLDSKLGKDFIDRIKSGQVACGDASVFQKEIATCMEEKLGKKLDQCFALACSEAKTCIQKIQGQSKEPIGEEPINIDPSWKDKISTKLNACVVDDIRVCLAKDCSEFQACIDKFKGDDTGDAGGPKLDPGLEREITAKVTACTKAQSGQGGSSGETHPSQEYGQPSGSIEDNCSSFASISSCSYVGSPDSDSYKYCKQCFPDR